MRLCFFLIFVLTLLNSTAQKQAIINGTISGLKEGSKIYVVPNSDEVWRDSTVVQNGSFHFKLIIPEATSYSIRLSREYKIGKWKDFYIDQGVFNIKGTNGDFSNVSTSGSQYALDYNNYIAWLTSKKIIGKLNDIERQSEKASQNKDSIQGEIFYEEYKKVNSLKTALTKQWIINHSSSPISAYLLYDVSANITSIEDLETILNILSSEAKANIFGKKLQTEIDATKATAIGKIAPDFTQNDTLDRPISLRDFWGKYLLIDFWASWCVPCRAENPNLVSIFKKFKDKNFTILSVSLDSDKDKWLQAIRKDNLLWTQVSDLKFWDNDVAKQYNVYSVPSNLLLDPQGKIIAKNLRSDEVEKALTEYIK
jgi:peroxiredoxin